ncbi:MAG: hypothetical protein WBC74_00775 [Candidatus Omnitrophota bacterium]
MKKVAVITQSKDAAVGVKRLGKLGVLHVEHQKLPGGKDISALRDDISLVDKAMDILREEKRENKEIIKGEKQAADWKFNTRRIVDLRDRLKRLEEYSRATQGEINEWESWGDFDPAKIKSLAGENIHVRLYRIPVRDIKKFPDSGLVKKLSVKKGIANCAVISREKAEIPFKELALPRAGLGEMRARLSENNKLIKSIKEDLKAHLAYINSLAGIKKALEKELEFQEALNGMGTSGEIMYLTGYIPHDAAGALLDAAKREKWGISVNDPLPEDRVPTLIRNPKWVSIIAPLFRVMDIMPGYHELDISLWFLIFLSVFFGMLIGDAGYGIVFFILTLFLHIKLGKKMPNKAPFILFYTFSLCAVIWGVLTGTFFGQAWLTGIVKPLMPALRDNKNIQVLCFLLGALHLSIAHLWRAIIKFPSPRALSDIGWISILWGAFFLAKTLILAEAFPWFGKWFFIAGPVMVVLFTNFSWNIFKGIGSGFGSLLLNFVNCFTDVVSYIRLFAVGLATVAIADAFNKMALGIGFNTVLTGLATALILLLGHALNMLLGALAILVHGVRLNVLEFSSHLDVKWSGFLYRPLKEKGD